MQKKEKFFDFDTSASGGFSRKPCGRPAVYNSGVRAEAESRDFLSFWWKTEVLPTSRQDLRLILLEDSGKTFSWKKRAVAGENYERPVVFWKPSRREVIG